MAEPRPLHLTAILEAMADTIPNRLAVVTIDREYTYTEIDERATRLAHHLAGLGVGPGDHVAIHSANRIEWIDAFFGCMKLGAVPINVNYKYQHDELAYLYDNADCVAVVVAPEHVAALDALDLATLKNRVVLGPEYDAALAASSTERIPGRSPDDLYVVYTGGTTGAPKGVIWRQEDLIRAALNANRFGAPLESVEQLAAEAAANDNPVTMLACGPLMHGGSQWILGNSIVSGSTVALYTEPSFSAERILDLVQKARVLSLTFLGDAMGRPVAEAILAEPDRWDLSSLAAVSNGAAPLSEGVREQIRRALPGRFILDVYGSSEGGAAASKVDDGSEGPAGAPNFGSTPDVGVFDRDLLPCPAGVEGMFGRTGPIPLGYYKDPLRSAETFKTIDGVRWVFTGDSARREADGSVTLLGRGSACINTGGEKVHAEEVEAVLLRHDDVFDAAVVGTPHERWGQQVTAVVQLRKGSSATQADLREHAKSLISNYKVPKAFLLVGEVPRTSVGKIDYPASLELASSLLAGPGG